MAGMGRAEEWGSRWGDLERRAGLAPHLLPAAAAVLGVAALTEAIVRVVGSGDSTQFALVLCLLALATTLPLGLPRPAGAAVAVGVAAVLSLAPFHSLTVAGVVTQLVALYRLGRVGPGRLAAGIAAAFLVVALVGVTAGRAPGPGRPVGRAGTGGGLGRDRGPIARRGRGPHRGARRDRQHADGAHRAR